MLLAPNNARYEKELEALLEERYGGRVYLTYKGREAISLLALLIGNGRKTVAVNGFTCFAVYEPLEKAGYKVSMLDIEKGNLNFTKDSLEKILKKESIAAVIVQNTLGYPCDIKSIKKICEDNNILLVEDLAHSVGARYSSGQEAGTVGDFVILTFSQDKLIDAMSGGALIVRNKKYEKKISYKTSRNDRFRDRTYPMLAVLIRELYPFKIGKLLHVFLKKAHVLSSPMDGLISPTHPISWESKFAIEEFRNLEKNLSHRKLIAKIYQSNLNKSLLGENTENYNNSSNLRFPIFLNNRKLLIDHLKKFGVYVSDIWYDAPIAPRRLMSKTLYAGECPNSEVVSQRILNLPTHRSISENDARRIVEIINKWEKSQ